MSEEADALYGMDDAGDDLESWCDCDDWNCGICHPKPKERRDAKYTNGDIKQEVRGSKAKMVCHCGGVYLAREADIARGWAKSCSKRCAAIRRDFGRPAAKRANDQGM